MPNDGCPIDFNKLCDNNDFRVLTNGYNKEDISELVRSIPDNDLHVVGIKAIRLQKKLEQEEDEDAYLDILEEQAILQAECSRKYNEPMLKSESSGGKGLLAREWGILMYYLCESHQIYLDGESKNLDLEKVKMFLSQVSGLQLASFNNLCIPNFNVKADRRAMNKIKNITYPVFPALSKRIGEDLDE